MAIRIIADSTCEISQSTGASLNLDIVPLRVTIEDVEYLDGVTLTNEEFYTKLEEVKRIPITSQPSPMQFMGAIEDAKMNGDEVVIIAMSSAVSGTYQSACIAKENCEYEPVYIVDSQTVTLGNRILVDYAIKLRDDGLSAKEIADELDAKKGDVKVYAIVDTLKYLQKGGRLSAGTALAGSIMGVKPIIAINNGKVEMADKARGLPGAYVKIFKLITECGGIDESMPYYLGYTGKKNSTEPFNRYITSNLKLDRPKITAIGPIIGTHVGSGASGIAFFKKG